MPKHANLARMTTATTGTGTITLGSAVAGYLTFASAGVSDGDTVSYSIADGANSEVGYGVYTASGTTLTRNVITSTNSNSAVSLSGSAQVFITVSARDLSAGIPILPQGRLTFTTDTPVMTGSVTAGTTVYYAPFRGRNLPIWDGYQFVNWDFGAELSQATTDTAKSPAACVADTNYDVFGWRDGSTFRISRGPAWSSSSARGTGAGTTELEQISGLWVNKIAITNGPAARYGTYLGTIRTNSAGSIDWNPGAVGAGGTAGIMSVWNAYQQVNQGAFVGDSTNSWSYNGTWRAANNSATMRVSFIVGLASAMATATYNAIELTSSGGNAYAGVGYDTTTAYTGSTGFGASATGAPIFGTAVVTPAIGWHYFSAIEYGNAASQTFYGDNGASTYTQTGLTFQFMM